MKRTLPLLIIAFLIATTSFGQNYKKLSVFKTDFFDSRASITVEALNYDPVLAVDALKNALVMNSFKVISERVAKERVEINNKIETTENSVNQDISAGKTKYMNSVYVVTLNYKSRADTGCGGQVMSNLLGQIIDLANDGQIVATFTFRQGSFEGKCTENVMMALAKKLK